MGNYRIDPKKQFSKKLAKWTAVFWFFYMTWLSVIVWMQPQAALYCVYMGINVTVVMVLNVWAYTKNSIYEKGAFALLDKTRMELSLKTGGPAKENKEGDSNEESDMTGEEGGNG